MIELLKLDLNRIPKEFQTLFEIFKDRATIRLVGGAVRDLVLGNKPNDLDFAIDISPEKVMEIAKEKHIPYIPTGLPHGTVTLVVGNKRFEITTLRVDTKSIDGRHSEIAFTDDWQEDAARRDFTINAFSMDNIGNVYDYFNGIKDLESGIVRFVGDPNKRIQEDGLRILRFFRFCGKINATKSCAFEKLISDDYVALDAIKRNINCLDNISRERISNELHKIADTKDSHTWYNMYDCGVLSKLCIDISDDYDIDEIIEYSKNNFELIIACGAHNKAGLKKIRKKMSFTRNENKLLDFLVTHNTMILNEENIIRLHYKDNIRKDYIELLSVLLNSDYEITSMIINEEFHKPPISKTEVAQLLDNKSLTTKFYNRLIENFIQSNYEITKEKLLDKLDRYCRDYDRRRTDKSNNEIVN